MLLVPQEAHLSNLKVSKIDVHTTFKNFDFGAPYLGLFHNKTPTSFYV